MSQASSPPGLAEAKPLTFVDHVVNIFHLVIKELRSIRADPVMLLLVVYSFSISVNTVATGAVTEATNLSVGIVDEDGSDLSRRIAEGLRRPTFQPPVQITASDIDPMMDQGKLLFVVEIPPNFEADIRAQRQTGLQINVDATAVAQAGNGASSLRNAIATEIQRFISGREGSTGGADQSRRARRLQPEPQDGVVFGDDPGRQPNHDADCHPHRRGADPRARAGHGRAPPGHAGRVDGDHAGQDDRQRPRHPGRSDAVAAIRGALVDRLADQRVSCWCSCSGAAIYALVVAALGILLGTLATTMGQFGLLAMPVLVVTQLLSGSSTPMESMPVWLQYVMQTISPTPHFVAFSQAVLFRGADITLVWRELAAMLAIGVVYFTVASVRFRRVIFGG